MQEYAVLIDVAENGTATATVSGKTQTFPDLHQAVEWAETLLYDLEGEDSG